MPSSQSGKTAFLKHLVFAVVAVTAAVFALVYVLISVGNGINNSFPLNVDVHNASAQVQCADSGVVINASHTEVIFLDEEEHVKEICSVPVITSNAKRYECVAIDSSGVYICEVTYFDSSSLVQSEKIVKYTNSGEKLGTVFEIDYDKADNCTCTPTITTIALRDGQGLGLAAGTRGDSLRLFTFPVDVPETPATLEQTGFELATLPDQTNIQAASYIKDSDQLLIRTAFNDYYSLNVASSRMGSGNAAPYAEVEESPESEGPGANAVLLSVDTEGRAVAAAAVPLEDATLEFAPMLSVRTLVFWICAAYLVLLAVGGLIFWLVRAIKQKRSGSLKRAGVIAAALVISACVVGYYSLICVSEMYNDSQIATKAQAATVSNFSQELLVKSIDGLNGGTADDSQVYREVHDLFARNTTDIIKAGQNISLSLITADGSGVVCSVVQSADPCVMGAVQSSLQDTYQEMVAKSTTVTTLTMDSSGIKICAIAPVYSSDGAVVGGVCATFDAVIFIANSFGLCLKLLVMLLSALILFGFVIIEGRDWMAAFKLRKKLAQEGDAHPEFALARPVMFLTILATSVDSTLLPIIAQEVGKGTIFAGNDFLLALPLTAFSLGFVVSTPVYTFLVGRFPLRRVLVGSSLLGAVLYGACAYSVAASDIVMLTISIFFVNAAVNMSCSYAFALPLLATDKDLRSEVNRSLSMAKISGSAISILIAGVLANAFGNPAVYVFGAFLAVVMAVFTWKVAPKGKSSLFGTSKTQDASTGDQAKSAASSVRGFLLDPPILALVVCVTVPLALATGYKSYLFPIFANMEGMDKATISNIVVFCSAIVFYGGGLFSKAERNLGTAQLLVFGGGILAVTLLLFVANSSLTWAVITLVISQILIKTMTPAASSFWQNRILETGASKAVGQNVTYIAEKAMEALRSPVLGGLLQSFGKVMACATVGLYCLVTAVAFALVAGIRFKKHDF